MKLALVHDWLTGMRGGEKCLEAIGRRFPDAPLFTLLHALGSVSSCIESRRIATSPLQRLPRVERYYRYLLPLMPWAVSRLRLPPDVDMVLSFSHAVAKSVQPPAGVPHVCYCFTPMRYAWHLRTDYLSQSETEHAGGLAFSGRLKRRLTRAGVERLLDRIRDWDRDTSTRVTHFVAISRTVAQRIQDCYGRPSDIIYPPVDTAFYTPDAAAAREGFFLCVSALVPYKRIDLAIQACNRLRRRLIVIGSGPDERRLSRLAGPDVQLLGWQSNEAIRDHLRRCRALLFPGREDFGIVPLEAQACGTPVIAYDEGGARETVVSPQSGHRGTGLLFPEQTVESLCEAMDWAERNPTAFSRTRARQQALRFSTPCFEAQMLNYLRQVLETGAPAGTDRLSRAA